MALRKVSEGGSRKLKRGLRCRRGVDLSFTRRLKLLHVLLHYLHGSFAPRDVFGWKVGTSATFYRRSFRLLSHLWKLGTCLSGRPRYGGYRRRGWRCKACRASAQILDGGTAIRQLLPTFGHVDLDLHGLVIQSRQGGPNHALHRAWIAGLQRFPLRRRIDRHFGRARWRDCGLHLCDRVRPLWSQRSSAVRIDYCLAKWFAVAIGLGCLLE